jgi:hypothetical protein
MNLYPGQRACLYREAFPLFPPLAVVPTADDTLRIEGLWIMGNNYRTSGYYGAYPHGYLDRVMSMFPDAHDVLHVPSGSIPPGPYLRIDIRPECEPDIVGDCHDIAALVGPRRFDLVLMDIPYSVEDADHYGRPMVNRNRVLASALEVTRPGGWVVCLDQVLPMFSKATARLGMAIGMIKSTNHRVRGVFGFERATE